jgi:hypothetical protein
MAASPPSLDRIIALHDRAVRKLVDAHVKNAEEPLLLAVRYRLDDPNDIYLLEVFDRFPGADDDPPLETAFERTPELIIQGKLHLALVSPAQLRTAMARDDDLIKAIKRDGRVEYQSYDASELVKELGVRPGVPSSQQKARLELVRSFTPEERATPEEMDELRRSWRQ